MITAIDTNILLDVLLQDPTFSASSKEALRRSAPEGAQVICEVVYTELAGLFPTHKELESFFKETGIRLLPSHSDTLWKAGELWRRHCLKSRKDRLGSMRRILADFLIGAHALLQAEQFLTRDQDFYRSVFTGLRLI